MLCHHIHQVYRSCLEHPPIPFAKQNPKAIQLGRLRCDPPLSLGGAHLYALYVYCDDARIGSGAELQVLQVLT